ncbi:MAG TPA: hypothetical protein VFP32_00915 [Candidatus Saccharimonadales bacterium]|nr:hypothetical protein [Candidatus Saccharimonadales bacterium]
MSSELTQHQSPAYKHFTPAFYTVWGDDPQIMAQARAVNDLFNTYLYAFGVEQPYQLNTAVQEYLNENSRIHLEVDDD